MTEDEAKTKWCAHVRHTALPMSNGDSAMYDNRSSEVAFHAAARCIASECMAWRWEPIRGFSDEEMTPFKGYCGLAGRP
jgi:hypothetical protein